MKTLSNPLAKLSECGAAVALSKGARQRRTPGRWRGIHAALFAGAVALAMDRGNVAVAAEHSHESLPNLDRRVEYVRANNLVQAAAASPARAGAENTLRSRLSELQLERHAITRSPKWVSAQDGFLTGRNGVGRGAEVNFAAAAAGVRADDPNRVAKAFINEHAALFGHDASALERAAVRRDYVTEHNGMRTTVWQQEHLGIEVFEAVFLAHTTKDGELVNVASQFVPDPAQAVANGDPLFAAAGLIAPVISAAEALAIASRHLGGEEAAVANVEALDQPAGPEERQKFRGAALKGEARVRLCWLPMGEDELRMCWRINLTSRAAKAMFRVVVDAETGEVWVRQNLTDDLSNASYRVYTQESPTPRLPGYSSPGQTSQPATVARQLVTLSALDTTASPSGWILDGDNQTRGNNVDAHTDVDDDDDPDLPRPIGSPSRVFDFPLDLTQAPSTYRDASVVNLFYWNNWMHDKLYALGFTEGAGNFQNDNFGRGGQGSDAVLADAQDGGGVNNANFGTPDDGEPPRMQMYIYDGANPDRDGALDATIILHEYTHGLSNRRVGGGVGLSYGQPRGMGEGWSDFYALALLTNSGDDPDASYPKAAYPKFNCECYGKPFEAAGDNYYFGTRRYPYCTDMSKNPLTFRDIDNTQASAHPGVPVSPWLEGYYAGEEHMVGEVWCMMLWECRAEMIHKHGFATGNQLILRLVTDGMGLSPANPTFVQARNAIYLADQVLNGGANLVELKRAFAKRGLGHYAVAPPSNDTVGVLESFETGPGLKLIPPADLVIEGREGGPFPSAAKVFTLQNDIAAAIGWSLFVDPPLEASAVSGSVPGNQTRTVNVTLDANAAAFFPVGKHYLDITFSNHVTQARQVFTLTLTVRPDAEPVVEAFDNDGTFDLEGHSITFTPEDATSYQVCRDTRIAFYVPTTSATTLNLTNDNFAKLTLSGGKRVKLYGQEYGSVYVSENGALTFSTPQEDDFTLEDLFSQPRVAGLYRDLEAGTGRISWQQLTNRLVVSWENVRDEQYLWTNSFQMEMFFDGVIRITWIKVDGLYGKVGLSDGGGLSPDFVEADFSTRPDCDTPPLKLTLPSKLTEGGSLPRGSASVSIPKARTVPTIVNLASSDTTELSVPSTVIIPMHETNAIFDVTVLDDLVRDGSQLVYVTATALNYLEALERVRVDDNENNPLTVTIPLLASESQGDFSGTIRVPNPVSGVVTIFLESSDTDEITVPPVVFMPAGQTSMVFKATVIDDRRIDGNLSTTITATVPNWTSGSDIMAVFDNEDRLLRMTAPIFILEGSGTLSNAGNVYLSGTLATNLTVTLGTSNFFELLPLGPVTIPAGKTNALFSIGVGDNAIIDGARQVALTASVAPFSNALFAPFIFDNDQPPEPSNPYPPDDSLDWPLNTHLAWDAAEGELIVNGDFETGDFTGWTVGGSGDYGGGGWVLNDGAFDPDSPDGPLPALVGGFSAFAVQNGNGRHTLSQEIFVPDGATSGTLLRWRQEIRNHAGVFASNQRLAVELRDAATDALLATLYTTTTNDPAFSTPTNRSVSIAAWRGQRVRIVFVEEDSLGALNVHLDNVSVIATSAAQTTYDVYFGNDTVPDATEYLSSTTNAHWDLLPLAGGLYYYWRIDSRRLGITNTGPVWNFRTAGSSLATVALTYGSAWKYVATGVNLGTGWRSPSYNDALWQTGTAPFGFGSSQTTTIGFATNDYTTFYFRRRLTVFDTNRLATVTASLKRDDGAVVYVNGIEAFRDNMPAGVISYTTQAASIVGGADETNSFVHAVDPSLFIEGTNIIAVEVHQRDDRTGPSSDLFFDLAFTFRTNTANLAPWAVNWITPGDFDVVRTPTNLLLRASVNDDNLLGTGVEIFADGLKIGEDTFTPFNITWTNPPVGLHTLLAVATDAGGLTRTSAPLHVLVTTAPGQSLLTLIPAGSVWRYRQNGEYPGVKWTQLGYKEPSDRSWLGGPAQLGYGDGDEATEFDFGRDFGLGRQDRPITAYFRHQFSASANLSALTLRVLRDDGVAVYMNNTEVFRNNLPAGTLASNTLALATIIGTAENTWLTASLSSSVLVSGANIAAAEVHQSTATNPDLSFDLELTGVGNFLPAVALTSPASDTALLSPPSVQIAAVASDAYGSVTNVQFFRNGVWLGIDLAAPYQFLWNNPPAGIHTLTAIAIDNLGATKTSAPVTLTIVPAVTLTARALATNVVELSWPLSAPGYQVETTPSLLEPIVWVPLNLPVTQSAGQFRVLVDPAEAERYFRLRAP